MSIPIHLFSEDQKSWYARFIVAAILADNEISIPEVEYIRYVMNIVSDPMERSYLIESIRNRSIPELERPKSLQTGQLVIVFIELILIMISDFELLDLERKFLETVSKLFGFPDSLYQKMINWGEEGLKWKNFRRFMVTEKEADPYLKVPLDKFSEEQKFWYAKALISAIICDGNVDENEIRFVNKAVSIVEDADRQKQLMGYVSNKMVPTIDHPPEIPHVVLVLIFMEMLLIVSADESLSVIEMSYLRRFAETCGFSEEQYSKMMTWCQQGIQWKNSKSKFIKSGFQLEADSDSPVKAKKKRCTLNSNHLGVLHHRCFICEHESLVSIYKLKKGVEESGRNIFEIPYYEQTSFVKLADYNLYRVAICPSCYFASSNQDLFMNDSSRVLPQPFKDKESRKKWINRSIETKSRIKSEVDLSDFAERSVNGALMIYRQAIESAQFFGEKDRGHEQNEEIISLRLHMAEILMKDGRREDAEKQLMQAAGLANDEFCRLKHRLGVSSFKSAKLLFLIALYFEEKEKATGYYNFFIDALKTAEENNGNGAHANLYEITRRIELIFEQKENYFKTNLNGFHKRGTTEDQLS
ncbi:DUF2225 domain-containing protein [bacterium]|nr:DUF2225 domain-containing protein [bacterium]